MRWSISLPLAAHRLFWTVLATALLFTSGPRIFRALVADSFGPIERFYSTDNYLGGITGASKPSQKIVEILTALPPQKPILIIVREKDEPGYFLGMTVAYLAWPRTVQIHALSGGSCDAMLAKVNPASLAAVVFCRVQQPAWVPAGTRIGRSASIVRLPSF